MPIGIRRFYDAVIRLSERPAAPLWLFGIAFAEASFFPVPPDALLMVDQEGGRVARLRAPHWPDLPAAGTLRTWKTKVVSTSVSSGGGCGPASGWSETVLHAFAGGTDGAYPYAGVITDKANYLYGTTVYGGHMGTCLIGTLNAYCGTAFKLTHNSTFGVWTEVIMHKFKGGADGANPYAALCCNTIFANPFFYGTTLRGGVATGGGAGNSGVVFKLPYAAPYTEAILYNFCNLLGCPDGAHPYANVIFDANSNMYGTTAYGGVYAHGTAYEMPTPYVAENVLYNFCTGGFGCPDGATPLAGLTLDSANNLYGTTDLGGVGNGEVFQLPFPAYAPVNPLQAFTGGLSDGGNPWGGVIFDPTILPGTLYGATTADGSSGDGVVYSVP